MSKKIVIVLVLLLVGGINFLLFQNFSTANLKLNSFVSTTSTGIQTSSLKELDFLNLIRNRLWSVFFEMRNYMSLKGACPSNWSQLSSLEEKNNRILSSLTIETFYERADAQDPSKKDCIFKIEMNTQANAIGLFYFYEIDSRGFINIKYFADRSDYIERLYTVMRDIRDKQDAYFKMYGRLANNLQDLKYIPVEVFSGFSIGNFYFSELGLRCKGCYELSYQTKPSYYNFEASGLNYNTDQVITFTLTTNGFRRVVGAKGVSNILELNSEVRSTLKRMNRVNQEKFSQDLSCYENNDLGISQMQKQISPLLINESSVALEKLSNGQGCRASLVYKGVTYSVTTDSTYSGISAYANAGEALVDVNNYLTFVKISQDSYFAEFLVYTLNPFKYLNRNAALNSVAQFSILSADTKSYRGRVVGLGLLNGFSLDFFQ